MAGKDGDHSGFCTTLDTNAELFSGEWIDKNKMSKYPQESSMAEELPIPCGLIGKAYFMD